MRLSCEGSSDRDRQTENDRQNAHTIVFVVKLKIKQVLLFFGPHEI